MFDVDSARNNGIINFLNGRQLSSSLRFYRDYAVGMESFDTLITFIRNRLNLRGEMYLALLKHLEVMLAAFAHRNTKNIPSQSIGDNLNFLCLFFLFLAKLTDRFIL